MKTVLSRIRCRVAVLALPTLLLVLLAGGPATRGAELIPDDENSCLLCHGNPDVWEKDTAHLFVKAEDARADIHWQKGLRCHDCHGGDPTVTKPRESHAVGEPNGLRVIAKPADVPEFCGRCHADAKYMAKFQATPKTDAVAHFWGGAHGQHLKKLGDKKDAKTVTCSGCHPKHAMTAVADPKSVLHANRQSETCGQCHKDQPVTLSKGAHGKATYKDAQGQVVSVGCLSCHGTDAHGMTPVADPQSPVALARWTETCGQCHKQQTADFLTDVHGRAVIQDPEGRTAPMGCSDCHGTKGHGIVPAKNSQSPVFVDNQVENCGRCHEGKRAGETENHKATYLASVHGHGLVKSGLLGTAVCSSCHGAHGIQRSQDEGSTLASAHVAATCGKCHRLIEERLEKSVHGRGTGPGAASEKAAPGGQVKRTPSCTDCHTGHDRPRPDTLRFRLQLARNCAKCHEGLAEQYGLSLHGELTEVGYGPAANCADCHGAHDILSRTDENSRMAPERRMETCRKCHPNAADNLVSFDPHADHKNAKKSPVLNAVYLVLMVFLVGTFGVFGIHSILWFIRELVGVMKHGRPKSFIPGNVGYVRFHFFHRVAHALLLISFLGLALTGLPLKYSHTDWAQSLARALGGFGSTNVWHRIFGLVNMACLAVYIVRLLLRLLTRVPGERRGSVVFGPDSPVPNLRDVKDFFGMVRWFFGLGPRPAFDRWAYWEKVDFWGAAADSVIIGLTGFILWFPNLFCTYLPGETVNIAKVIHSTQALLATGFVFAIHFFSVWLRPEKFPMDMAMFTGVVSEHDLKEERPAYYERLRAEGRLDKLRTVIPGRRVIILATLGGYAALTIGTALLIGIIAAAVTN